MTRRKFRRKLKIDAVKLVTDRGVSVAQACRDLDLAESVLQRSVREAICVPTAAFPGNGQQRAEMALRNEPLANVARFRLGSFHRSKFISPA